MQTYRVLLMLFCLLNFVVEPVSKAAPGLADPLPSWREGPAKSKILNFVRGVTDEKGPNFVPVPARLAAFDNDGTLWVEQPFYTQFAFAIDRVRELAPNHPEWEKEEPFRSILAGDFQAVLAEGEQGVAKLIAATHAGMNSDEFADIVEDWIGKAKHQTLGKLYIDCVYQPMLELISYLQANQFKTYIVSGGGADFIRPWSDSVYGIPPEWVIGSRVKSQFQLVDGQPTIQRLAEIDFVDDKAGKPIAIQQMIGRRPIAAFGNSDGDLEMLQWTTVGRKSSLGLIVHHTDATREWAYDRDSVVGRLADALDEAEQRGWVVVDIARDWRTIYPQ